MTKSSGTILAGGGRADVRSALTASRKLVAFSTAGRGLVMLAAAAALTSASIAVADDAQSAPAAQPVAATQSAAAPTQPAGAGSAQWWSYQPVKSQSIPQVHDKKWARTPIDSFVLARLEANDIKPSAEADRATFIRRATLDTWGLIPEPRGRQGIRL